MKYPEVLGSSYYTAPPNLVNVLRRYGKMAMNFGIIVSSVSLFPFICLFLALLGLSTLGNYNAFSLPIGPRERACARHC